MNTTSYHGEHMNSPLASEDRRRSDDDNFAGGFAPFKAKHEKSSKLVVHILAVTVTVSAVILFFAVIFLRATTPAAGINSVTVRSLTYTPSTVNATLAAVIAVRNPNLGRFEYGNSTAAVLFEGVEAGRGTVARGRVGGRGTAMIDVTVDVEMESSESLRSGVDLGVLKITSYGELRGRVHLSNLIKKEKIAIVSCTMNLNLTNRTVEKLKCK